MKLTSNPLISNDRIMDELSFHGTLYSLWGANCMDPLQIRELQPDDAEVLIAYTKQIGGESDNLTFGADGNTSCVFQNRKRIHRLHFDVSGSQVG